MTLRPPAGLADRWLRPGVARDVLLLTTLLILGLGLLLGVLQWRLLQGRANVDQLVERQQTYRHLNQLGYRFTLYQAAMLALPREAERVGRTRAELLAVLDSLAAAAPALAPPLRAQLERIESDLEELHRQLSAGQSEAAETTRLAARTQVLRLSALLREQIDGIDQDFQQQFERTRGELGRLERGLRQGVLLGLVGLIAYALFLLRRVVAPLRGLTPAIEQASRGESPPVLARQGEFRLISEALQGWVDQQNETRWQTQHDPRTGLFNESGLLARLRQQLAQAPVTLLLIEVPQAAALREADGSAAAEALIRSLGLRLLDSGDGVDAVARVGDFCFGLLLDEAELPPAVLRARLEGLYTLDNGMRVEVVLRLGLARLTAGSRADEGLRAAQCALYEPEGEPGALRVYHPQMAERQRQILQRLAELTQALANGEIEAWFEPTVDRRDGRVVAVEALARWQHPRLGLLPPSEFVPLAERAGRIASLDQAVLRQALQHFARLREQRPELKLAFNLSPSSLDERFTQAVAGTIARSGIPGESLIAELTEIAVIAHGEELNARIEALSTLGVQTCLDDFGTGYSSLSYLLRLPVRRIKIDRSFVSGIGRSAIAEKIIEASIVLAHKLELDLVAEGVETETQAQWLMVQGCHLHQGWLYSKAKPVEEMRAWLPSVGTAVPA
ncbi:MAG TPA: EAL domain-containing protein [Nevskiaceae bacterium]|nr:EAL domain-containing protein [Nevskiaceae bacterium]